MKQRAHLMMRYHAPLDDFDRHLKWVVRTCREASIEEVAFIVDPEGFYFGFPSPARLRRWAKTFRRAGLELRRHGIVMSINPWVTLSHSNRGFPPSKELGFTALMTGDDGAVSRDTACPADPVWQRYIAESYAILASAGPDILWLEDDFRLHNHGNVRFGCFAQPMLDEFARRAGRRWKREALVSAIVKGEGAVRAQWLKFTGDLWIEIATHIREAVHRVDPNVKLAQMTSGMAAHSAEGRRWGEYLAALAGPHQAVTRPNFPPYREGVGFDYGWYIAAFRNGLAFAGRSTRMCPELDVGPHSYFSRSRRQSVLQLELGQFFGCRDVTFNHFDLAANDPGNEPWVVRQLVEARPRMDALAALGLEQRVERGVHVWTDERAALYQRTEGRPNRMESLYPAFDAWAHVLARVGVAATYETPGALTAVSGDTIRAASANELRRLLGGGLLLDGRAALALQEMGYGKFLGVRVGNARMATDPLPITIERILDESFGLKGSPTMFLTQMGMNWGAARIYLNTVRGARAVSELRSGDGSRIGPGVTLYENALGGRVAVYPFDFDSGIADSVRFFQHQRKCQIQAALRWLNRGRHLTANRDMALVEVEHARVGGQELLAVINLGGDSLSEFTLELPALPRTPVAMLDAAGRWRKVKTAARSARRLAVAPPAAVAPFEAVFLKWTGIDGTGK